MTSGVCVCRIMPEFFTREVTINIIIQYTLILAVKVIIVMVKITTAAATTTLTILTIEFFDATISRTVKKPDT